jgi:hypothetical protein
MLRAVRGVVLHWSGRADAIVLGAACNSPERAPDLPVPGIARRYRVVEIKSLRWRNPLTRPRRDMCGRLVFAE